MTERNFETLEIGEWYLQRSGQILCLTPSMKCQFSEKGDIIGGKGDHTFDIVTHIEPPTIIPKKHKFKRKWTNIELHSMRDIQPYREAMSDEILRCYALIDYAVKMAEHYYKMNCNNPVGEHGDFARDFLDRVNQSGV